MSTNQEYIQFTLVTPQGVRYDDVAMQVTLPTEEGEITILPRHNVIISKLNAGEITVVKSDGIATLAISHGILEVRSNNTIYVMADSAEHAADIDVARAEEARKRAEELLASAALDNAMEYARIEAKIEKELARISVGKKYKDVR
jgi:F-type H+-transporting ATPase subunit epsilon